MIGDLEDDEVGGPDGGEAVAEPRMDNGPTSQQRGSGVPCSRTAIRSVDKALLSSDEDSDSSSDDGWNDDVPFKRKKAKKHSPEGGEDHPREFLEAWQQQKAKDRRQSDSRKPQTENGESVINILQSPSRSPRDIRLPGHTPSNSPKMKRKKNNIWGAVVDDQVLEQGMQRSVGLFEKPEDGDERGVESYNFEKAKEDTREFAVPESKGSSSQEEMFHVEHDVNDPFQKILEAEGLKSKEDGEEGKSSNDDDEDEEEAECGVADVDKEDGGLDESQEKRRNLKRTRDDPRRRRNHNHNNHNINIKDRVGPREWDTTMTCDENDDEERVMDVIQNRLKEPKRHLVNGVVSVLGKACALKFLAMTENIEEAGGMTTADNRRRRTPGGVYMQLIKTDQSLTKEQKKKVFEGDKRLYNHKQKEMRKLKFAQRNQWRERNEAEAGKLAAEWKGNMGEEEDEERKRGGEEEAMDAEKGGSGKTSDDAVTPASVAAAPSAPLSSIDDEFGGDEFDDVDAVKDDVTSGFGAAVADMPRERRRTPSPIEDLF